MYKRQAQAIEANQTVRLNVNGQELELLPDELLVESSSPEGYAVAEGNGVLVALDTTCLLYTSCESICVF